MSMPLPEVFETIMLVCFGAAWPVSIYKSYTSRRNEGKSIFFLLIIFLGYISGIAFQYMIQSKFSIAMFVFLLNIAMVAIDIIIFYRNERIKKGF